MIDPRSRGRELGTVRFPVDRSKAAELARALHDEDAAWHDAEEAQALGFAGVPTMPTVTVLADHWREGGALAFALQVGADLERLLHGEAEWELLLPVRVGDELTATARVADVTSREGRRGGAMTLVTIETEFTNQQDEVAVRRRDVLVEKGA